MSDLFDRLIDGVHGAPREIRPRPRARFETMDSTATMEPSEDARSLQTEVGTNRSPAHLLATNDSARLPIPVLPPAAPQPGSQATLAAKPPEHVVAQFDPGVSTEQRQLTVSSLELDSERTSKSPLVAHTQPIEANRQPAAPLVRIDALHAEFDRDIPGEPVFPRLFDSPRRSSESRDPFTEPSRDTAEPSVTITIGRIDIRAATPPPASPAPRRAAAPTHLSLEEYLRQRNEGLR